MQKQQIMYINSAAYAALHCSNFISPAFYKGKNFILF